jgi:cobalt-zinc-cadmium efflux system membrane fusion protein
MNSLFAHSVLAVSICFWPALIGCSAPHDDVAVETGHDDHGHAHEETHGVERDPSRLWCAEHNVYEDECFICHPELARKAEDAHAGHDHSDAGGHGLYCNEHDVPEIECGICQPGLILGLEPGQGMKIRLGSDESADKAGIQTAKPVQGAAGTGIEVLGQTAFNGNKLAYLSPLAKGVIQHVFADVGDQVKEGDVLAELHSAELAEARSALLKARASERLSGETLAREADLVEQRISARKDLQEAQAAHAAARSEVDHARQRLFNLGLTDEDIARVLNDPTSAAILPIRAPFDGTVVERHAVLGAVVDSTIELFHIADLDTMWMELNIPENAMMAGQPGAKVAVTFSALPKRVFNGELTWVEPAVDETTRLLQARAVLQNTDGLLKSNLFGRARITSSDAERELLAPLEAVQVVEGVPLVFVKLENDLYESRKVTLGEKTNEHVSIVDGASSEDEIVVAESYLLKAELLKSKLGAGCADH